MADWQEHKTIWLQPWCRDCEHHDKQSDTGRLWCQDDVWGKCDECGRPSVKFSISPLSKGKRAET